MKLRDYIASLSESEQDDYAARAGTTGNYLRVHIKYARRTPRADLMEGLWKESSGNVSREEALNHFYPLEKTA